MKLRLLFIFIFLFFFLTGCKVENHVTVTAGWLDQLKSKDFDAAALIMVNDQLIKINDAEMASFSAKVEDRYGEIKNIEVHNHIPLRDNELKELGIERGNWVFFYLDDEDGTRHKLKTKIVHIDGEWKIVWEDSKNNEAL